MNAATNARSESLRPVSPTLVRYVLRELVGPTLMGFGIFTFFLLMNFLLDLAQLVIRDGIGIADVGRYFFYSMPHIIVLTVPMAVLVGGLVAFGRLSADFEIIAMRSGGVSLYQLAVPVLLVGLAASFLNLYLFIAVLPWGNDQLLQLQYKLINTRTIAAQVQPRVFETRFPNFTLFIEDVVGPERRWEQLFLVQSESNPPKVVLAEAALARFDEDTREFWLDLENGYIYEGGVSAESASVTTFSKQVQLLEREGPEFNFTVGKNERTMSLSELRGEILRLDEMGAATEKYRVEVHKRYAIPLACLVMALISVPLGISTKRHTKSTGYLMAIGVIAVYYQFLENGEKFAEEGAIPVWLGMWSANLVIGVAALALLWAKAREKNFGIANRCLQLLDHVIDSATTLWHGVRNEVDSGAAAREGARFGGRRFPRLLDVYILRQFAKIFAMTLGGLIVIWIIFEYFEISDDLYAIQAGAGVAVEYFKFRLPFIFMMSVPIAAALTTLIVFSLMSKQNEVVAVLAGGTSLFRLAAPILIPALGLAIVQYAVSDHIAPHTNLRADEIKQSWRTSSPMAGLQPLQGSWARGEGRYFFNYADYDSDLQTFQGLYVYYIDETGWRLSRVDYAARAAWQDGRWMATDSWRRHYSYGPDGISSPPLQRFPLADLQLQEGPEYFATEHRLPAQMSAAELAAHIADLEQRGFDAGKYKIDLQQKFAFPAVVFVLVLVSIPFGFRMGRQGTLTGIALALGLTMLFWISFAIFQAIGAAEFLPAVVAAWTPHVMFLALAGYITVGLRT